MRVALVHMRHAATGGTERYLDLLSLHLARRGHDVRVVCRSHGAPAHPAVRFHVLHDVAIGGAWRMWAFARAVERHVRSHEYDVVYGLGKTWSHDVVRLGGGCHATYLELAHRATRVGHKRLLPGAGAKHRLALRIEERALSPGAYSTVVTNSHLVERDVSRRHGVPADRLRVIHNGVDLERFHPRLRGGPGRALRGELGAEDGALVCLFLGSGYGRKGLGDALRAFALVARRVPRALLWVAGFDSTAPRYAGLARELGIHERTRFLGGRADAETVFAGADLYVLPTRYDPFANATLEALASGLPAFTTDRNGAGELIEPGVQGAVLPVGDVERLAAELVAWSEPERLAEGRRAARRLAEQHGFGAKMEATEAVLEEAARARRLAHA